MKWSKKVRSRDKVEKKVRGRDEVELKVRGRKVNRKINIKPYKKLAEEGWEILL